MVHDGEDGAAGSGFGVGRGVDEAGDAGVEDGSGAHGAGLEGGVEGAVFEAIVVEGEAGFAEGYDLGVGGGVGVAEDSVLASADDFVFVDDDCAYGDFAVGFGGLGFGDGGAEIDPGLSWLLSDLRFSIRAEESGNLFGEDFESWPARGQLGVIVDEVFAPDGFENWKEVWDSLISAVGRCPIAEKICFPSGSYSSAGAP